MRSWSAALVFFFSLACHSYLSNIDSTKCPWLSLPGHYRVTDEVLLAETT